MLIFDRLNGRVEGEAKWVEEVGRDNKRDWGLGQRGVEEGKGEEGVTNDNPCICQCPCPILILPSSAWSYDLQRGGEGKSPRKVPPN